MDILQLILLPLLFSNFLFRFFYNFYSLPFFVGFISDITQITGTKTDTCFNCELGQNQRYNIDLHLWFQNFRNTNWPQNK